MIVSYNGSNEEKKKKNKAVTYNGRDVSYNGSDNKSASTSNLLDAVKTTSGSTAKAHTVTTTNKTEAVKSASDNLSNLERASRIGNIEVSDDIINRGNNVVKGLGTSTLGSLALIGQGVKQAYEEQQERFRRDGIAETLGTYARNLENPDFHFESKPMDTNTKAFDLMDKSQQYYQDALEGLSPAQQFLGQTGISMLDNLTTLPLAVINPALPLVAMSAKATGNRAYELAKEGKSATEALGRGLVSGAIEGMTEMTPLDELLDAIKYGGKVGQTALKQALSEGGEEALSYLLNYGADRLAGDDIKFSPAELGLSALGGVVSGGLMGTGGAMVGNLWNSSTYKNIGQKIVEDNIVEEVIQTGLESAPDTESHKLAQQLQSKIEAGGTVDEVEIGELYVENTKAIEEEEKTSFKASYLGQIEDVSADDKLTAETPDVAERSVQETAKPINNVEFTDADRMLNELARERAEMLQQENEYKFYEAKKTLGKNGAKVLDSTYKPTDNFDKFYKDFSTYYEAGSIGTPMDIIDANYKKVDTQLKLSAYMAGQKDAEVSFGRDKANAKVYTNGEFISGTAPKNVSSDTLAVLNSLAKATGNRIRFEDKVYGGKANGQYLNGEITIAKDAEKPFYVVAKHEVTHGLQVSAPVEYRAYRNYTVQLAEKTNGRSISVVEQYKLRAKNAGINLTTEQAMDEIAADFTEKILKDGKTLEQFIEENIVNSKSMLQKFFDAVHDFIKKVKAAFNGNRASMNKAAIKEFGLTIAELEKAEKMWLNAVKATYESSKNAQQNKAENVGNTRGQFSLKDSNGNIRFSLKNGETVYAPPMYSQLERTVEQYKGNKISADGLIPYLKGKGVKDEEIKWSGIANYIEGKKSIAKDELLGFVRANELYIDEEVLEGNEYVFVTANGEETLETEEDFEAYVERYVENDLFVDAPDEITYSYDDDRWTAIGHYEDEDGDQWTDVIMMADRETAPVTNWEEFTLYNSEDSANYRELLFVMPDSSYSNQMMKIHWGDDAEGILAHARVQDMVDPETGEVMLFVEEIQSDWHNEGKKKGYKGDNVLSKNDTTPDAPFKDSYVNYVLKRLIRDCAERGIGKLAWATSEIQVDRWSEDFREGYRIEYDQEIPKFLKKYGKQWGAKLGQTELDGYTVPYIEINNKMRESVLYEGQPMFSLKDSNGNQLTEAQAEFFKDSKVRDKNGNLKVMYHGTADDFTVFNPFVKGGKNGIAEGYGIYFADTDEVAGAYGGKILKGYLNVTKPASSNKKTIKKNDLVKLIKATAQVEAKRFVDEGGYDNVNEALRDTWISNYVDTYGMSLPEAYRQVADSILSLNHDDMNIVQEVMVGLAVRDYEAAYEFYDVLKDTLGIDGFVTEWENKNISSGKAQIVVAFDSNQFKNTDNLNPTDDPDIRFSLKDSEYMEAVNNGDMETAQRLVDEAAEAAGYTIKAWHGSRYIFNEFSKDKRGINTRTKTSERWFFAGDKDTANSYYPYGVMKELARQTPHIWKESDVENLKQKGKLYELYLRLENPLVVDVAGYDYASHVQSEDAMMEYVEQAERNGNDGIILLHVRDNQLRPKAEESTVYMFRESNQAKSADPVVYDDNGNVIPLSERFNENNEDIRWSLKDTGDILKENAQLKEYNEYLKSQMKLTKEIKVDQKELKRLVNSLAKEYGTTMPKDELFNRLNDLYTFMWNGKDFTFDDLRDKAIDIVRDVVSEATAVDDDLYNRYVEIRDLIRKTRLVLSEEDRKSVAGGYKNFRKANMGRLNLANDGISVDSFYQQLSEMYPDIFDAEAHTNPADQLENIVEELNRLRNAYEYNPYDADTQSAVEWMANDIIDRYFELSQAKPTYADKQKAKVKEKELATIMHEGAVAAREARFAEERLEALRREKDNKIKEIRKNRDKKIENLKEAQKKRVAKMSDKRKRKILRDRIARHTKDLSTKLLKGSDKSHVPHDLRMVVVAVIDAINLESSYSKDPKTGKLKKNTKGEPTKRTKAFRELKEQYEAIKDKEYEVSMVIDPALLGDTENGSMLDAVIKMKDTRISDMTLEELETVWKVIRAVEKSITSAGKTLSDSKYATTKGWAEAFKNDTFDRKERKSNPFRNLSVDLETPYTFFAHFGQAGKDFFRMLRNAQDKQQVLQDELKSKVQKVVSSEQRKALEQDVVEYTTEKGDKLILSKAHLMEIYLLSKREQARGHLLGGGIVQPKIKQLKIREGTEFTKLTENDLANIEAKLNDEEKRIADELQKITLFLAEKGNEASMLVFGYEKFNDPNYWTIKSSSLEINQTIEKGQNQPRSIKNMGSAKGLTENAKNSLSIGGIFNTFDAHASDMITYSAWLAPMEDANRLFNFSFKYDNGEKTGKTIKGLLSAYAGEKAEQYWLNLMEDIQNGIASIPDDNISSLIGREIGKVKGASVASNIRVVVQQPTSFIRAGIVLSPDNMLLGMTKGVNKGNGWEKAKKYAPIARMKEVGGFEVSSSPAQLSETLYEPETKKGKALHGIKELPTMGASKADAVTWGAIWNACEWQVHKSNESLDVGSDEFNKAVAELFTEVIDQTQVVDGVLQRSQTMRSSNWLNKQASSFMGEPTLSLNLLLRSYDNWKSQTDPKKRTEARKKMGQAVFALMLSNFAVAVAQSSVDGLRDDDEEKKYLERFLSALTGIQGDEESLSEIGKNMLLDGNLGESMNVATWIPYVKDGFSILQGYDVERLDASAISDFISAANNSIKSLSGEGEWSKGYALSKMFMTGAKLFGSSASNVVRDIESIVRSVFIETENWKALYDMKKQMYNIKTQKGEFMDVLYKAYENNLDDYTEMYNDLLEQGISEKDIKSAMESRMKKAQNVDSVYELEERWFSPSQQKETESVVNSAKKSSLWNKASQTQKAEFEAGVYEILNDKETQAKMKEIGMDTTDYALFNLALSVYDEPNKNGNYGTYTNKETAEAILNTPNLTDKEMASLWNWEMDDDNILDALAKGYDIDTYLEVKADTTGLKKAEKREYLNDMDISDDEYKFYRELLKL